MCVNKPARSCRQRVCVDPVGSRAPSRDGDCNSPGTRSKQAHAGRRAENQRGTESHLQKEGLSGTRTHSHTQHVRTWDPGHDLEAVAEVDAPEGRCARGGHV